MNNYANMPWVWLVAQRLEQQPRKLKMWGSIPCHAHNFLIHFAIGVRTTIEHRLTQIKLHINYRGLPVASVIVYCSYRY